ncbi:hypothetical protein Tsubulata_008222 [Turnera subulata]|uniref:RING-type domain-containing protein n=1 Tax=Turnera subulata TaxID=218843 RepID=A0A9Q0G9Y4_9ROSI|nr:hypothetical protein Tsubulata_008222 [Turnera subulata]
MARLQIEEARVTKIRVFKWNAKLENDRHESYGDKGFFFLKIANEFSNGFETRIGVTRKALEFQLDSLTSPHKIDAMVKHTLVSSAEFLPETIHQLAGKISSYLTSRFRFQVRPNSAMTVLVANMNRKRSLGEGYIDDPHRNNPDDWNHLFPPLSSLPDPLPTDLFKELDPDVTDSDIENDPSHTYPDEIIGLTTTLWHTVRAYDIFPTKPITGDEPIGFVQLPEISLQLIPHPDVRNLEDSCAVCLEAFSVDRVVDFVCKTPCSHLFHAICINKWLSKKLSCPMCRSSLPQPNQPCD